MSAKLYVIEIGDELNVSRVEEDTGVLRGIGRAQGASWILTTAKPRRYRNGFAYLAQGPKILDWPNPTTYFDVGDKGEEIEITPEYLDYLVKAADTEAMQRGSLGITLTDRLIHVGAGTGLGMLIAFLLVRFLKIGVVTTAAAVTGDTSQIANETAQFTTTGE